jgi:hypothetical protein
MDAVTIKFWQPTCQHKQGKEKMMVKLLIDLYLSPLYQQVCLIEQHFL